MLALYKTERPYSKIIFTAIKNIIAILGAFLYCVGLWLVPVFILIECKDLQCDMMARASLLAVLMFYYAIPFLCLEAWVRM